MQALYLYINIFSVLGPLLLSFDKKVAFYKKWKAWLLATIPVALAFIIWDILFTKHGIWGFNPDYLIGINIVNLPLEECLFFITIPYCCMFIHECNKAYFKKWIKKTPVNILNIFFLLLFITVGFLNIDRLYTSITFLSSFVLLSYIFYTKPYYIKTFYWTYFISLIPFLIVNGILTGTGIKEEVVWYNSNHIQNIKIGTIPVEDSIYLFLLLLGITILYEKLLLKKI